MVEAKTSILGHWGREDDWSSLLEFLVGSRGINDESRSLGNPLYRRHLGAFCTVRPGQTEALRKLDAPIDKLGHVRLTHWADYMGCLQGQLLPPTAARTLLSTA